jgi:hypothetical protein
MPVTPVSAPELIISPLIVLVAVGAVMAPEVIVPVVVILPEPRLSEPFDVLRAPPAVAIGLPLVVRPPGIETV